MDNITAMLQGVLTWLTNVATWIVSPDNQLYLVGMAISVAGMVIGLMRRTFRK